MATHPHSRTLPDLLDEIAARDPPREFIVVVGERLGAAPGPDRALLQLLRDSGIDPAREGIAIAPVPGAVDPGASFGVLTLGGHPKPASCGHLKTGQ